MLMLPGSNAYAVAVATCPLVLTLLGQQLAKCVIKSYLLVMLACCARAVCSDRCS